ncbi:MAG: hypothetical protein DRJ63_07075, partial [Thermoprotei archaeon]
IYYIVGTSLTIIALIGGSIFWLGRKLGKIDDRFDRIDERFNRIDKKFEEIDRRFDEIDERFNSIDRRFEEKLRGIRSANVAMNSLIVEFLGMKGVISGEEAGFLSQIRRISAVVSNPLTKEEIEFLRRVSSKSVDELTLEEAERISEIGKR